MCKLNRWFTCADFYGDPVRFNTILFEYRFANGKERMEREEGALRTSPQTLGHPRQDGLSSQINSQNEGSERRGSGLTLVSNLAGTGA